MHVDKGPAKTASETSHFDIYPLSLVQRISREGALLVAISVADATRLHAEDQSGAAIGHKFINMTI